MAHTPAPPSGITPPHTNPRAGWLDASVAAGFIATIALTATLAIGYGIANASGNASGNTFQQWLAALSRNELVDQIGNGYAISMFLNLIMGIVWAIVYARWAVERLPGTGWQRGILFSLGLWLLSVAVFFPLAGVGFFGSAIDAGPLPVLGNLILHVVYGAVLGTLYRAEAGLAAGDPSAIDPDIDLTPGNSHAGTIGLVGGGIAGLIGGWLVAPGMELLASQPVIAFAGLLLGGAVGITVGMVIAMANGEQGQGRA